MDILLQITIYLLIVLLISLGILIIIYSKLAKWLLKTELDKMYFKYLSRPPAIVYKEMPDQIELKTVLSYTTQLQVSQDHLLKHALNHFSYEILSKYPRLIKESELFDFDPQDQLRRKEFKIRIVVPQTTQKWKTN